MKNKSKNILITGVSSGIGYSLAQAFTAGGYRVFGSVRTQEDAQCLQEELGDVFTPLVFDVTDHQAVFSAAASLEKEIGTEGLGGLINNAGLAVAGPFMEVPLEEFRYQLEVNVLGMVAVTKAFLPLLGARDTAAHLPGKIVQISSVSGRMGMPFVSPYVGSKYAMEGISDSLRRELLFYGIDVILVEPGPIRTPIWKKSMDPLLEKYQDAALYPILKNSQENFVAPSVAKAILPEKAAALIVRAFEKKKSPARLVIVDQKLKNWTIPMLLPTRMLDWLLDKALGLSKKRKKK